MVYIHRRSHKTRSFVVRLLSLYLLFYPWCVMSLPPYPGFSPSFTVVDTVDGCFRECIVLDILTELPISKPELAHITEMIEAYVHSLHISNISGCQVVTKERFDPLLSNGLRLSRT